MTGLAVPNKFPAYTTALRVAIIGDCPTGDDFANNKAFVGKTGGFLGALLSRAGVQKDSCYQGFISNHALPYGIPNWNSEEIQEGLHQLNEDLKIFKPNVVLLFGDIPLKAAKDPLTPLGKSYPFKVAKWRGSFFLGHAAGPFANMKCVSTFEPKFVLYKDYDKVAFLQFDLRRMAQQARSPVLELPQRAIDINLTEAQTITKLREIREKRLRISPDIEGYVDSMSCIGIATSPHYAFVTDVERFTDAIWREMALTLSDPNVPKILMNGFYDSFILSWCYGIEIGGFADDIQMGHWELYSELAKDDKTMSDSESATTNKKTRGKGGMSLAIQASMYTMEPYWKGEGKDKSHDVRLTYCGKDCCVQFECWEVQSANMQGLNSWTEVRTAHELDLIRKHKQFNSDLIPIIRYIIRRGINYDSNNAKLRRVELQQQLYVTQARLNALTGYGFSFNNHKERSRYGYTSRKPGNSIIDGDGTWQQRMEAGFHGTEA